LIRDTEGIVLTVKSKMAILLARTEDLVQKVRDGKAMLGFRSLGHFLKQRAGLGK
jgi:hypothetical protein